MTFRYPRIFWLEDNPNFFIPRRFGLSTEQFDVEGLLSRVTFAFSFEMGQAIVAQKQFDLFILDGDFPDGVSSERKSYLEQFLALRDFDGNFDYQSDDTYGTRWNNFVRFYKTCLKPEQKTVIYSMSQNAAMHAFAVNIPFYLKMSDEEEIGRLRDYIPEIARRQLYPQPTHSIESWELGTSRQFAERYLFAEAP